jgi:lipooligosaccharide transport system ATP-binding protein
LDPQIRHVIWQKLQALKEQGKTIILTTHYMDEAEKLCDRLLIMDKGKIIRDGIPQQLVQAEVGLEVTDERFGRKYKRPANLEDVFLKLTGHGLDVGDQE